METTRITGIDTPGSRICLGTWAIGGYDPLQMTAFRRFAPLSSVQSPYNLFERALDADVLPDAREAGLTLLAYGALCRGLLHDSHSPCQRPKPCKASLRIILASRWLLELRIQQAQIIAGENRSARMRRYRRCAATGSLCNVCAMAQCSMPNAPGFRQC